MANACFCQDFYRYQIMVIDKKTEEVIGQIISACKKTHDDVIGSKDAFVTVGIGADGAATSKIDKELETQVLETLNHNKIGGTLISEEIGIVKLDGPSNDLIFIVDPLDGTNNAKTGFPYYALSLSVVISDTPLYSCLFEYPTSNFYSAKKGQGAFYNNEKITVSEIQDFNYSKILTARPFDENEAGYVNKLMLNSKRTRITGCPSLDVAMVAKGSFEAYIDYHPLKPCLKTHDIIAASHILKEAGGLLYDESGQELKMTYDTTTAYNVFAANSPRMIENIFSILDI